MLKSLAITVLIRSDAAKLSPSVKQHHYTWLMVISAKRHISSKGLLKSPGVKYDCVVCV